MIRRIFPLLAFALYPIAGQAQSYDTTLLFQLGAWKVEHTYQSQNGSSWCAAETVNDAGQVFSIVGYPDGSAHVVVMDFDWKLTKRPVKFRVDIDYEVWHIDGTANDISVSVGLTDPETSIAFITDLMKGRAVAIYNQDSRKLAVFSLSGSGAAILRFMECWKRIDLKQEDPFSSSRDPFVGMSDPF